MPLFTRLACSPREAFFGPSEALRCTACVGRVSAEMVVPYPPGIPVLGPGEEISAETVDFLAAWRSAAASSMVRRPSLVTLRVVARSRSRRRRRPAPRAAERPALPARAG